MEDGGKASFERGDQKGEVTLVEGKVTKISFVEPAKFQDQEFRVEYTAKIDGTELKLHRKLGDITEYDIVAKRESAK